jgi:hypothetical protein
MCVGAELQGGRVTLRSSVDLEGELAKVMASPPPAQMHGLVGEWVGKVQSLLAALRRSEKKSRRRA